PEIADVPDAVSLSSVRGDIRFEGVTFGYEPSRTILNNIHLTIRAGETVAFVGPSGAGKTTICSLLPRFYDVDQGKITVDGIDIRNIKLQTLRKPIGIVQQDGCLFSGTIRDNIAYGDLQATDQQIWDAGRRASLEELIRSLPDGMETVIGERGAN
ncbi:ATP-binding cassette domain-containing protein, partial [Clostridium perfringens]